MPKRVTRDIDIPSFGGSLGLPNGSKIHVRRVTGGHEIEETEDLTRQWAWRICRVTVI